VHVGRVISSHTRVIETQTEAQKSHMDLKTEFALRERQNSIDDFLMHVIGFPHSVVRADIYDLPSCYISKGHFKHLL